MNPEDDEDCTHQAAFENDDGCWWCPCCESDVPEFEED